MQFAMNRHRRCLNWLCSRRRNLLIFSDAFVWSGNVNPSENGFLVALRISLWCGVPQSCGLKIYVKKTICTAKFELGDPERYQREPPVLSRNSYLRLWLRKKNALKTFRSFHSWKLCSVQSADQKRSRKVVFYVVASLKICAHPLLTSFVLPLIGAAQGCRRNFRRQIFKQFLTENFVKFRLKVQLAANYYF